MTIHREMDMPFWLKKFGARTSELA